MSQICLKLTLYDLIMTKKSSTLLKDSWFEKLIDYYMMHLDGSKTKISRGSKRGFS
jgi:hypothetical protein